jgi:hypothetical protein
MENLSSAQKLLFCIPYFTDATAILDEKGRIDVACCTCKVSLSSFEKARTSNLLRHLKNKHIQLHEKYVKASDEAKIESKSTKRKVEEMAKESPLMKFFKKNTAKIEKTHDHNQIKVRELVANLAASSMVPLSFFDNDDFKKLTVGECVCLY